MSRRRKLLLLSPAALILLLCVGPGLADDSPEGTQLLVVVRDAAGRPAAACRVLLAEPALRGMTDADGCAWFTGLAPDRVARVALEGSEARAETVLQRGSGNRLEIVLDARASASAAERR